MILVTGATGFLGARLVMQLAASGQPVRCIKRPTSHIPAQLQPYAKQIEWFDADVKDITALEAAFEGVMQVYHCAAWVSFSDADREPMINTNVTGTANIVNLCLDNNIRLLHVSSIAAIGQAKPGNLITEENHIEDTPVGNPYSISKLESEMEVWRGIAEGLDAVIVNPSVIIGASAGRGGSGKLFGTVQSGTSFYTNGSCGLVDVDDVAKCMIILMDSGISGERFIISAENRYFKELLPAIAQKFGVKPPMRLARPWMLELAWRGSSLAAMFTGGSPSLDKTTAGYASMVQNYDNRKIKDAIGFQFKPVDETIDEIVAALKEHAA